VTEGGDPERIVAPLDPQRQPVAARDDADALAERRTRAAAARRSDDDGLKRTA
jgi:hypothetical protein